MKVSKAMKMIRKIRDENSERHSKMSVAERKKEANEALAWFSKALKKPLTVVNEHGTFSYPKA